MKMIASLLMMLVLSVCRADADDAKPLEISTASLISLLPTQQERERWKLWSREERASPKGIEFAEKLKNFTANCQQLQARLLKGKPVSDYPGLLALGRTGSGGKVQPTFLKVERWGHVGSGDYAGFIVLFDQSQNITTVSSLWTPGF